jgi:3-oxoacyl-[acyl-carrier-protein] synthase-3
MRTISLIDVASYMPRQVVDNEFFLNGDDEHVHAMFRGVKRRHHVSADESAVFMIDQASRRLAEKLNLNLARDVDVLITNVTCPDMPFTGCGATVAHTLGCRPKWVLDMHNGGCVSFIQMISFAQSLMTSHNLKSALLCNVQNSAGRIFSSLENRVRKQARIPGDGCGVGYFVANSESPVLSVVQRNFGEYADDMAIVRDDGSRWWEPSTHAAYVDFSETKIADIMARANRIVPEVIFEACGNAGLPVNEIDTLVTNQPNRIFLRNWREALQTPRDRHVQTFERHGNLFGAALPICIEEALNIGQLKNGSHLVLGGFSHAGDYAASAVIQWRPA